MDITGLSYVVEEMELIFPFPFPFTLKMDSDAARIFCLGTAQKIKLKHIDCRQEWVKTLRNKDTMTPVHNIMDTVKPDAETVTKVLARGPSKMVRNRIMMEHNVYHDE